MYAPQQNYGQMPTQQVRRPVALPGPCQECFPSLPKPRANAPLTFANRHAGTAGQRRRPQLPERSAQRQRWQRIARWCPGTARPAAWPARPARDASCRGSERAAALARRPVSGQHRAVWKVDREHDPGHVRPHPGLELRPSASHARPFSRCARATGSRRSRGCGNIRACVRAHARAPVTGGARACTTASSTTTTSPPARSLSSAAGGLSTAFTSGVQGEGF